MYDLAHGDGALTIDGKTAELMARVSFAPGACFYPNRGANDALHGCGERHRSSAAVARALGSARGANRGSKNEANSSFGLF